jgi:hypothetical protein
MKKDEAIATLVGYRIEQAEKAIQDLNKPNQVAPWGTCHL